MENSHPDHRICLCEICQSFHENRHCVSEKLLKSAGATIVPYLTILLNMSFRMSKVPEFWKNANVTPIHKKEDKDTYLTIDQSLF